MEKIKKVLNHSSKDDSGSNSSVVTSTNNGNNVSSIKSRRRPSKTFPQETPESVGVVVSDPTQVTVENGRRISLRSEVPKKTHERRPSLATALAATTVAKTETQKVAAPVVHNLIKHQETEEVTRAKEHERHFHHVQHHVQPVKDTEIRDEVHHTKIAPVTAVNENFTATAEDAAAFESLGAQFKDLVTHAEGKREVIDLGENVQVKEHHHIHNVIQPVIEKETHDRHRIHTTIPIHHVTHEAPIIHESIQHEPLNMSDFLKNGGSLVSTTTHSEIGKELLTESLAPLVSTTGDKKEKVTDQVAVESSSTFSKKEK